MEQVAQDEILKFKVRIVYQTYYSDETSWGVYNFVTTDNIPYYVKENPLFDTSDNENEYNEYIDNKEEKHGTLAGKMQELSVGGDYIVQARCKENKIYGVQYEPLNIYALIPHSKDDQVLFLKSLISENVAENLINAYPDIVEDVINGRIDTIDYSKVKGVGEYTWNSIKDKILNNFLISDIIVMLKPLGVTYTMIQKLLSEESNPALLKKQLEENPYILTKIPQLGFKRVDDLALKLKPELLKSFERLVSFIQYYLKEMGETNGHTWCSKDILLNAISDNVPQCLDKTKSVFENNNFLHIEEDKVGLKYYYDIEMEIFQTLRRRSKENFKTISDEDINIAIEHAETEQEFKYVPEQIEVIKKTLNRGVSLISGQAGTGKTSIMRGIIKAYVENHYSVTACALSAMASQRITEATNYPAMTIHRTLGYTGLNKFQFNKDNKIITDVMFLDEGSMVNASLFLTWLNAIDDYTTIIICGDHKQLPPIGFGNIFSDLLDKLNKSMISKLEKPMRQAERSGILSDARLIRKNVNPIKEGIQVKLIHGELKDMYYMFRTNRESLHNIAIKTFLKSVDSDGLNNVVIAVPRKSDCLNSTRVINNVLQDKLLPNEKTCIENSFASYKLGAKVMQTVNNYDLNVFNGEIGYIIDIFERINNKKKKEKFCTVKFTDIFGKDKYIEYSKKDLLNLELAYAMTVHKLQGAGYKTVIGIVDNTHYQLLDNCMLYTMITRAKQRCLLLAEPQAFMKCIHTSHNNRNTWVSVA